MDVEETILRAFIRKTRVERHVALLRTPTRRAKLIAQFHDLDLDPRFVYFVPAESQGPASLLYDFLRRCGATDSCYVMSADSELDGREMDLRQALELTVNYDSGTLISCIPGELAYYEGDDSCRYILQRPAT